MIPAPRPPAEDELPPEAGSVLDALAAVTPPQLDEQARARMRERLLDEARRDAER
ncbi:hypothetical protein [Micromonospora sp. NPDC005652]|uniref:hypothetical protein n=1 Tax=Micromonospora sp. NPDC005652 TaxID=3157046 RepID=UPI0033CA21AD